jgi:hypothetical protein
MPEAWLPQPHDFGSFANLTQVTADPEGFSWLHYREMLIDAEYWNTRQKFRLSEARLSARHQTRSSRSA